MTATRPRPPRRASWLLGAILGVGGPPAAGQDAPNPQDAASLQDAAGRREKAFGNQRARVLRLLAERNYTRASAVAERMVESYPEVPIAWKLLVECHLQPGWLRRNDSRCEEAVARLIELVGDQPEVLRAQAIVKFRQRRPEAIQLISRLVDGDEPMMTGVLGAELLHMRARLRVEAGESEAAASDLDRAIAMDPGCAQALVERGGLRLDDGAVDAALGDLQRALQVLPGDQRVHFLLSRCHREKGEMTAARHHREVSGLINRLVDSTAAAGEPDLPERLQILARLRAINPSDLSRRIEYVDNLMMAAQREPARTELSSLQEEVPGSPAVRALTARVEAALAGRANEENDDGDG